MKKLLVATSALVAAAGSAAALDVTLSGEISITSKIDLEKSGFNGVDWDAEFTLAASGESMGWTYGGTLEFGMFTGAELTPVASVTNNNIADDIPIATSTTSTAQYDVNLNTMAVEISAASVYMGGDFMGKISVQDECGNFVEPDKVDEMVDVVYGSHCVEWTGLELGGVELKAAIALDAKSTTETKSGLIVGASADMMGVSIDAEYDLDNEGLDLVAGLEMGGFDLEIGASYKDADGMNAVATDEFDYSITAGTTVGDFGVSVEYAPEWRWGKAYPHSSNTAVADDDSSATAPEDTAEEYFWGKGDIVEGSVTGATTGVGPISAQTLKNSKDIMVELTYGDCWTIDLGIDPVDDFTGGKVWKEDSDKDDTSPAGATATGTNNTYDRNTTAATRRQTDLDDDVTGDMYGLYMWKVEYECDLHDGVEMMASIGQSEAAATEDLGNITGSVGMTVSF